MAITASMVKDLRDRTGAGMMECKQALTDAGGDLDTAVEALRKSGAAKADKKAGRIAAEGTIAVWLNDAYTRGVMVEVNCETDFVAKDENFQAFARAVTETVAGERPDSVEALSQLRVAGGETVDEARQALIAKVGEKVDVRRFASLDAPAGGRVSAYLHGIRIGVLVGVSDDNAELGKDVAMHVAASRPLCVSKDQVPEETLDKEREIYMAQAQESGKPANIIEKIVEGRIKKYLNEVTLLGQAFVKDPDKTVAKLLTENDAEISGFVRYEVGEGLERRADDFVAEVMAQAKGG